MSILVKNGVVVTMNLRKQIFDPGAVFVEGTRITAVGPNETTVNDFGNEATKTIDAAGKIVMPGLVDAHYHTCQQMMRGLWPAIRRRGYKWPGWKYYLIPFESGLSSEDVYLSGLAASVNMLRVGTTCFSEHGVRHPGEVARAMEKVGVRGLLAISTMDRDDSRPPLPANMLFTTEEALEKNLEVVTTWPFRGDGLVRGCFSLRQIIVCTPELIRRTYELAEEHDTMVQTHANEGYYEIYHSLRHAGERPADFLARLGALSQRTIAAHSVLTDEAEIELFAQHGVRVAHCPSGNLAGLGMTNLPLMRRLGVPVGIGSDGASGGSIDLFDEMRLSCTAQQLHFGTPKMSHRGISDDEMLKMVTIGGARAIGLDEEIGSLEKGKRADLIVLAPNSNSIPTSDPVATIVSMDGRNVETVVVNGQMVMQGRKILTIDEKALLKEVVARSKQLQQEFLASL